MLTQIRNYKTSLMGLMLAGFLALLMVGFGMNFRSNYRESQAGVVIRVNDHEVNNEEFYRQVTLLTENYRERLGENFGKVKQFLNLEQQSIDSIIEGRVAGDFLQSLGLYIGTDQIEATIAQLPFFAKFGLSRENYENFLRSHGLTGEGLEEQTRQNLKERQLQTILADLNQPSEQELKSIYLEKNTKAAFQYLSFKPADFESKVDVSDEAKLKEFYEKQSDHYEKPRSVSYSFVKFAPEDFLDKVEVSPDDVRELYNQKQSQFYEPKELKLREIVFQKDSGSSAVEQMVTGTAAKDGKKDEINAAKKKTASSLVERLKAGEDFQALARQYSEDKGSAAKGGDMGWIITSNLDQDLRSIADRVEQGKFSDVIETATQYVILQVDDIKERKLKPFEEVRPQLEREIRMNDAPEYARIESENFLLQWQESKLSLAEFAAKEGKTIEKTGKLLPRGEDPSSAPGLTAKVITYSQGDQETVHAGNFDYAVEINETKDSYIPELAEVKDQVIKDYRLDQSRVLAKTAAEQALAELRGGDTGPGQAEAAAPGKKSIEEVAANMHQEVRTTPLVTREDPGSDPLLSLPDARRIGFSLNEQNPLPKQVIQGNEEFFVLRLSSRQLPNEDAFLANRASALEKEEQAASQRLGTYVLQSLRAEANIWVSPTLLDKAAAQRS
jgi:peptidyl-prolyl cis-trans isomerase D